MPSCGLPGTYLDTVRIYGFDGNRDKANGMREGEGDTVPNTGNIGVIAHHYRSYAYVSARYRRVEIRIYFLARCNPL